MLLLIIPLSGLTATRNCGHGSPAPGLYYCISGSGGPVVVFESGMRNSSSYWTRVANQLARTTTVVVYDRAGSGRSPVGKLPRSSDTITDELAALMNSLSPGSPLVLVGHSIGGWHARVFANRYPANVAGVVLIDSPHEDFEAERLALLSPSERAARAASLERSRAALPQSTQDEYRAHGRSRTLLSNIEVDDDTPYVVITSEAHRWGSDAVADELEALWLRQQRALVDSIPNARLIIEQHVGHDIPREAPESISAAVEALLEDLGRGIEEQSAQSR
ncbi:MAG: alpha/beta hydrolase [Pseudomonadota bacterium]